MSDNGLFDGELFKGDEQTGGMEAAPDLEGLFELSVDAYTDALYAYMSELPVKAEIARFVAKVLKAGSTPAGTPAAGGDRAAAAKTASDRGDPDVFAVQKAAGKVRHEIHRLTGMLRFRPDESGAYIARCAPDHFVLPALEDHFTGRFGATPWAIIDEKRRLCLCRKDSGPARLIPWHPECLSGQVSSAQVSSGQAAGVSGAEDLWRLYFRSINIESRKNLHLQHQLIPERYRKYMDEFEP